MHLPSLTTIDVQGNIGWRPADRYLLQLPRLKEFRNVSWAAECMDCWLVRSCNEHAIAIHNNSHYIHTSPLSCSQSNYTVSDFLVLLARHRFLVRQCRNKSSCAGKETNLTKSHPCWPVTQRVMSGLMPLGILGGCLNLVVFFNIALTKSLRKNVSLVLVSNLALGDTLNCLHSTAIVPFMVSFSRDDFLNLPDSICSKVGFLWVLGQCTTSVTSVALTVERYLCIVFSMKPHIRMTLRLTVLTIAFNWLFAASMASVAFFFHMYRNNYVCIPISFKDRFPIQTSYTLALGSIGLVLYLATIPLYIHIYMVVKRSSEQMGVKRESTLARRIAILVGTNLVFFFTPVLSLGGWVLFRNSSIYDTNYSKYVIEEWVPLYCLSINSCLNPLLHAFRNDKFKTALKKNLSFRTSNRNHVIPAAQ